MGNPGLDDVSSNQHKDKEYKQEHGIDLGGKLLFNARNNFRRMGGHSATERELCVYAPTHLLASDVLFEVLDTFPSQEWLCYGTTQPQRETST